MEISLHNRMCASQRKQNHAPSTRPMPLIWGKTKTTHEKMDCPLSNDENSAVKFFRLTTSAATLFVHSEKSEINAFIRILY